jgi:8-hydroxy-5-deazaflavin:NADPH oxidoreductase
MKLGIIGAGRIGATAARLFVRAGHEVALSNSRGPDSLKSLVAELGPRAQAMTVADAARFGEVVMEAIPFKHYRSLPADALAGKVLISAANYYAQRDGEIKFGDLAQTELVQAQLREARVVKAFNTIYWEHLRDQGDLSKPVEERRAIFLAGDDEEAKRIVAFLVEEIGFGPVDTGSLREGGKRQEPGSNIYNKAMTVKEAREALSRAG